MSPVEFKKGLCRPVEFKGQGPQQWETVFFSSDNNISC